MAGTDERPPEGADEPEQPEGGEQDRARAAPGEAGDAEPEFDAAGRELCPDGACVGVIGPDGRCKECGTPAEPS